MSNTFNFTQGSAATTWNIEHDLNCSPVCDIIVDLGGGVVQKILPASVKYIDNNNLEITFTTARSGWARLIGNYTRESRPAPGSIDPGAYHVEAAPPVDDAYRFFRLRINSYVGQAVRLQSVQLMVGGTSYPPTPMTSNDAPAPLVASASTVFSSFEPYLAFVVPGGGSDVYRWIPGLSVAAPQWIQIDLGAGNEITPTALRLCPDSAAATDYATNFTLLGSNTGAFTGEEVVLFNSGVLTAANWTANTVTAFTLLTPPWALEQEDWAPVGTAYWTLVTDTATSPTPLALPSGGPAVHGHLLAEGEYTDVFLGGGYSGDVGFLGVTDHDGTMLYNDTGIKSIAWYWNSVIFKDGTSLGAGTAPSNLTGPQRYRIARGPSDTIYFSKVSDDGSTLQGTVYSNTMTSGYDENNLHVVLFGQEGYPAPTITAYPVQTGTGGLYTPSSPLLFEADFSLMANGVATTLSAQNFNSAYANAQFGTWPAAAPLYSSAPWPEYWYGLSVSDATSSWYVNNGKMYQDGTWRDYGLMLPLFIPNSIMSTGVRITAKFVAVTPAPAGPFDLLLPNLKMYGMRDSNGNRMTGEIFYAFDGTEFRDYSDLDMVGSNTYVVPNVWDGQEHTIVWELNDTGRVALTLDGTPLGIQGMEPWYSGYEPNFESYFMLNTQYLGDGDTVNAFGWTYVLVETL